MRLIPGPDFPTGGQILGREGIRNLFEWAWFRHHAWWRRLKRSKPNARPRCRDYHELPYQTNKAALIERIAELVNDKKLEGISDIRDEGDRDGMRIVVELRRDAIRRWC